MKITKDLLKKIISEEVQEIKKLKSFQGKAFDTRGEYTGDPEMEPAPFHDESTFKSSEPATKSDIRQLDARMKELMDKFDKLLNQK